MNIRAACFIVGAVVLLLAVSGEGLVRKETVRRAKKMEQGVLTSTTSKTKKKTTATHKNDYESLADRIFNDDTSNCFVENAGRCEMTLTQEEGLAIAKMIYSPGSRAISAIQNHLPNGLNEGQVKLLMFHMQQSKFARKIISDLLKVSKYAYLATRIAAGSLGNPLAAAYFIVKMAASLSMGGTGNMITHNGLGGLLTTHGYQCFMAHGTCGIHDNGVLDCYDYPDNPEKYVLPIKAAAHDVKNNNRVFTCGKGTCSTKDLDACLVEEGMKPFCVSPGLFSLNKCICGVEVARNQNICFKDTSTKPTLGKVAD